ncbi:hypothetical protein DSM3645_16060 [Blastopirellula marina DSM 3645]|uniref:Uncharacterized protein n=2 Tax=Blastopirellula marina TaxID=124 RepID=A3ZZQ8_9BACT|nr:hypothetical protein DSM3645_16060 [Blastopirellula marina DSM 3645]
MAAPIEEAGAVFCEPIGQADLLSFMIADASDLQVLVDFNGFKFFVIDAVRNLLKLAL